MAALFWVGGSTAYDGVTNRFATSTGGVASVALVTSADDVTFDTNSGAAAVTTSAAISCKTLTLDTGFTGSLTMSNTLTATGAVTLTQGTLNTNGVAVTSGTVSCIGSLTRTLTLGATTWTVTTATTNAFNVSAATGLTLSATSSTLVFNSSGYSTGTTVFTAATGLSFGTINVTGVGEARISTGGTANLVNLSRTGTAVKTDALGLTGTWVITGSLTSTGNSTINRVLFKGATVGSPATLNLAGATLSFSNTDVQDIVASGQTITGTSLGDCAGNTNVTCDAPVTNYWRAINNSMSDVSNWASTSLGAGGSGRVPLPQDTARFDANSPTTSNVNFQMSRIGTVDFTGWPSSANVISNAIVFTIYGDLTMHTGAQGITGWNSTQNFAGRGNQTITTNGKTLAFNPTFVAPNGTYTLQDDLTCSANILLAIGTLNTNNKTVNTATFKDTGASTRTLTLGSSNITVTSTSSAWSFGTSSAAGLTVTPNTATVTLSGSTGTFQTGGVINYNGTSVVLTGSGRVAIGGGNCTIANLTRTAPGIGTVVDSMIFSGSTTTITNNLTLTGNYGNPLVVSSDVGGAARTVNCAGRGLANYCVIRDITATGGATFTAINSQNVANNTGWTFTYARSGVASTTPRSPAHHLFLPGVNANYASAPDAVGVDITGDIDIRNYFAPYSFRPAAEMDLLTKWEITGNKKCWATSLVNTGVLRFYFSTDGSTTLTRSSTSAIAINSASAIWTRATLKADNGAAGHDVTFYTSTDGQNWTQLGAVVTTAGTVSIVNASSALRVGTESTNSTAIYSGKYFYGEIRSGIAGAVVANPDFRAIEGAGFTDSVGNPWAVNASGIVPAQLVGRT